MHLHDDQAARFDGHAQARWQRPAARAGGPRAEPTAATAGAADVRAAEARPALAAVSLVLFIGRADGCALDLVENHVMHDFSITGRDADARDHAVFGEFRVNHEAVVIVDALGARGHVRLIGNF